VLQREDREQWRKGERGRRKKERERERGEKERNIKILSLFTVFLRLFQLLVLCTFLVTFLQSALYGSFPTCSFLVIFWGHVRAQLVIKIEWGKS
jgi:hypothetical protein